MSQTRSPGVKLILVGAVAVLLALPLLMVYSLVTDREEQSRTAESAITAGWGGRQVVSGPVIAIPYVDRRAGSEILDDGDTVVRTEEYRGEVYLSPSSQSLETELEPQIKSKSIYNSVIYLAGFAGQARFELPEELGVQGISRSELLLEEAEIRFGVSDPRGLQSNASVALDGANLELRPGKGVAASGNSGFYTAFDWSGGELIEVRYSFSLRGSHSLALVPRGGNTEWSVTSPWPHPAFGGGFLPEQSEVSGEGFSAQFGIANLALGQPLVSLVDPVWTVEDEARPSDRYDERTRPAFDPAQSSHVASIGLVEPVDLYSQVDRAVKYGFLFIGFTFLVLLMFDVIAGAAVATAEYVLTGAGLVLFFVMLLAFAEVIGFMAAYLFASTAIIGLLTAYTSAVLKSWKRARFMGAMLVVLYAAIYVLLSLEAFSLLVGSVLLFLALAGVMYGTRNVDWSSVGQFEETASEEG